MVAEPASEVAGGAAVATHLGRSRASFRAGELGLGGGWVTPEYAVALTAVLLRTLLSGKKTGMAVY